MGSVHAASMEQVTLFSGGDFKPKRGSFSWVTTKLVRESGPWYAEAIASPDDIAKILREHMDIENLDREHFIVLYLNQKNRINAAHTVSVGGLSSALVSPREVFKPALLSSSASLILAHNHPSGDPAPSSEDVRVTKKLVEAGEILGIGVLDHIIVGDGRYNSLKAMGLM